MRLHLNIKPLLLGGFFALLFLKSNVLWAQNQTERVLFLGNSYTYFNDLPQLIADLAASGGDSLYHERSTPGGYTLQGHSTNANSLSKINSGNWDHLVLQEQSQRPSFPLGQVQADVFPYAEQLNNLFIQSNPCGETVFFMTWGRENGDAMNCPVWPPVCTYEGMDSLLHRRYRMMADSNEALLSPVGAVWHYLRQTHPSLALYASDGSHPSLTGSYAAACTFYSILFEKDPAQLSFHASLDSSDAGIIQRAARDLVYDSLHYWNVGRYRMQASIEIDSITLTDTLLVSASVQNAIGYHWLVNGSPATAPALRFPRSPAQWHHFALLAFDGCDSLLIQDSIFVGGSMQLDDADESEELFFPNPSRGSITISPNLNGIWQAEILDLQGRLQHNSAVRAAEELNVSFIPPGVYILHLKQDDLCRSRRLLICP